MRDHEIVHAEGEDTTAAGGDESEFFFLGSGAPLAELPFYLNMGYWKFNKITLPRPAQRRVWEWACCPKSGNAFKQLIWMEFNKIFFMTARYLAKVSSHVMVSFLHCYFITTNTSKSLRLTTIRQGQVINIMLILFWFWGSN